MKCDKQNMLLYAVTDRAWVGKQTLYEQVESALKGGVTCVQLREKELDDEAFLKEAVEIHALCQRYGVPFFVNDNVDIAIRCHAEGVHVGQEDMAAAQVRASGRGNDDRRFRPQCGGSTGSRQARRRLPWRGRSLCHPHQDRCGCSAPRDPESHLC